MVPDMQRGRKQRKDEWRRLSERWLARNRQRFDQMGDLLARQLDFWNRKLAERAVPKARRERVQVLALQRNPGGPRFRLAGGNAGGGKDAS